VNNVLELQEVTVFMKPGIIPIFDINLSLSAGEVIGILGANGMGKTTVLETIAGFIKPDKGKVIFQGEDITLLEPSERAKKGIVYCPERGGVIRNMTVEENILLASREKNSKKVFEEIEKMFPRIVKFRKRLAKTLSGGEQKMLLIARAFVMRPKLLLLDEPSAGLAPAIRNEVCEYLLKLKEMKVPMIIVEQDPSIVLRVADTLCLMEWGHIRQIDKEKIQDKSTLLKEYFSKSS